MNDEQKKKDSKPIGGINRQSDFATFGKPKVQTSRPSDEQLQTVQTSPSLEVQTSRPSEVVIVSSPNVKRSKHPDWKQQTIYLPPDIRTWLRVLAAQSDTEVSEIVTQALLRYKRELESL